MFGRVVHPLLQTFALLVKADVQHKFDDDGAGFRQHALKVVDLRVTLRGLLWRDPLVHHRHQHIFVVAAVEDHPLACTRHGFVDTPKVVVGALFLGRRFPADGVYAQRAGAAKHTAQCAVFARSVGALQHHQQLAPFVHEEPLLQRIQLDRQRLHRGFVLRLVAAGIRLGPRVETGQGHGRVLFGHAWLPVRQLG